MTYDILSTLNQIKQEWDAVKSSKNNYDDAITRFERTLTVLVGGDSVIGESPLREKEMVEEKKPAPTTIIKNIILDTMSQFTIKEIHSRAKEILPSINVSAISDILYRFRKSNPNLIKVVRNNEGRTPAIYLVDRTRNDTTNRTESDTQLFNRQMVLKLFKDNLPRHFDRQTIIDELKDKIDTLAKSKSRVLHAIITNLDRAGKIKKDKKGQYYL
jgi:hypothetical protein